MNSEVIDEIKNKKGQVKIRTVRITNKQSRKGLTFDSINTIYGHLRMKYGSENITITAKYMDDTHTTLKNSKYLGDNLKYVDDEYFDGKPTKIKNKLQGRYYSIDVTYNL